QRPFELTPETERGGRRRGGYPPSVSQRLLAAARRFGLRHPLRHLRLHRLEVEARAPLHRRKVEEGLELLGHDLLDEHEAPELELEPVEVLLRAVLRPVAGPPLALERIQTQVDEVGDVHVRLLTEPPRGLIDEAVLVVVDAHRTDRALAQVEDLVPR